MIQCVDVMMLHIAIPALLQPAGYRIGLKENASINEFAKIILFYINFKTTLQLFKVDLLINH